MRWILTADDAVGRLVRVYEAASGRVLAVIDDEIHGPWAAGELATKDVWDLDDRARRERFAKEIAVWLEQHAEALLIDRIAVFAPPSFLEFLRLSWSSWFALRVDEYDGHLTHLTPDDLADHAAILQLIMNREGPPG